MGLHTIAGTNISDTYTRQSLLLFTLTPLALVPVRWCGVGLQRNATGSRRHPLALAGSIFTRMQFAAPSAVPFFISSKRRRFSSTGGGGGGGDRTCDLPATPAEAGNGGYDGAQLACA